MNSSNYSLWPVSQKENKHLFDTELEKIHIYPNFTSEASICFCSREEELYKIVTLYIRHGATVCNLLNEFRF